MSVPRPLVALLAVVALLGAALAGAAVAQPASPAPGTDRLAGGTRIGTAVAISQRAFPGGATVAYLARADDPVDAVAGGSLTDGPILLVPTCELPDEVAGELARLAPDEVIALGGTAVVCDDVLVAAAAAAGIGGPPPPGGGDVVVTATAEVVEASGPVPFAVEVRDPGVLSEGQALDHAVLLTAGDGPVVLDDPRFSAVMRDGEGQLVVTGRGCGANLFEGEAGIACQDDFRYLVLEPGVTHEEILTLHTDDAQVGPTPVLPGTYVLDQPVRWEDDVPASGDPSEAAFDDGTATIRISYEVTGAGPDGPVVTWDTPEGSFRTSGHSPADLERIAEGVEAGRHIGIPNGVILRGDAGVNDGRSWHLVDIELVDVAIEVCDGTADYVEAHLEDYLALGRYCPWGAVPTAIEG